jgi:hypothetical protein
MIIPSFYDVKFNASTQLSPDSSVKIKITTFDLNDLHRFGNGINLTFII